ncbi:uncharacterized protein EI97DRAFT_412221 [Westerdykella ornata]|uniref:Uncharacterized protein n=1 Tax=Westerdykella ornata TaxID=318751 RepID=A0A6A6JW78_WESOR|nr:uncharacterized protein EI97DRAFT_412221 [Westerdykella ornata]KAF2279309.1 hypothetical protein EI97DRAFT_412221 [Westerdykella ornata]
MSTSWLQRKRKAELLELAQQAKLPDAERYLKDDLVEALQNHLEANETLYGKQSAFSEFYARHVSPIKRERLSSAEVPVVKTRRRQTLKRADSDEPAAEQSLIARSTPKAVSHLASRTPRTVSQIAAHTPQIDLPASPAQITELADQSFQAAKTKASELWERTRIEEAIEIVRENASSVVFIQLAVLAIEALGMEWNTLNTTPVATPAIAALNVPSKTIDVPDLSLLLTTQFWGPATLWSLTSWVLPLLFSYFFNLTLRSNTRQKSPNKEYRVDPLSFNIARALLAYNAYGLPVVGPQPGSIQATKPGWGPFSEATVHTVRDNVPGRYYGLQIGSIIGILYSLYDAALRK